MPYDGSGFFTRSYNWTADKLALIKITSVRHDAEDDNFATALNQVLLRNGVVAMSGDLKLGGNKITGIGAGAVGAPSLSYSGDATSGIYFPAAGVTGVVAGGIERARAHSTGFSTPAGQKLGAGTATPRTTFDADGVSSLQAIFEDTAFTAFAATGVINFDVLNAAVAIFSLDAVANFSFNVRGDGSTTLDSIMAVNQTVTMAVEVPQGATAYYCTTITVDGAAAAQLKWFNGGTPTQGNVSGIDVYTITVFKRAAGVFWVRASLAQVK